jgi:hypothetical protein
MIGVPGRRHIGVRAEKDGQRGLLAVESPPVLVCSRDVTEKALLAGNSTVENQRHVTDERLPRRPRHQGGEPVRLDEIGRLGPIRFSK